MFIKSVTGLKVVPSLSKANTDARSFEGSDQTRRLLLTAWTACSESNLSSKSASFSLPDDPDAIPDDNEDTLQDDQSELEDEEDDD